MKITAKVTGMKEIEAALMTLEKRATRGTVLRNALKAAAVPMADELRREALAIKDSGLYARYVLISTKLAKGVGDQAYAQAMRRGLGAANAVLAKRAALRAARDTKPSAVLFVGPAKAVPHAHLVEFGTRPHIVGGKFAGAKHRGTQANPIIRRSWEKTQGEVMQIMASELRRQVDRAISRQAKRKARAGNG